MQHDTVSKHPETERLHTFLHNLLRVLSIIISVNPAMEKAIFDISNAQISSLDNRTPMELIAAGRTDAVAFYLDSIADGFQG